MKSILLGLAFVSASCSTVFVTPDEFDHMICIDEQGAPADVRPRDVDDAVVAHGKHVVSIVAAFHTWQQKDRAHNRRMMLIIHGGLVTMSDAVSEAREGNPRRLRRRLAGDLDSIVLKALLKEPKYRYGSVEKFSDDLRRHLDGLPVLARKSSSSDRIDRSILWAASEVCPMGAPSGKSTFAWIKSESTLGKKKNRICPLTPLMLRLRECFRCSPSR